MSSNMAWNLYRLFSEVFRNWKTCVLWCKENGLLPSARLCPEGHTMVFSLSEEEKSKFPYGRFRCFEEHENKLSYYVFCEAGTWFDKSNFSMEQRLLMTYCFSVGMSPLAAIKESSSAKEIVSTEAATEFYHYCRELLVDYVLQHQIHEGQLGGEGETVEIYESKFGQRTYNRSKVSKGTHIIGITEKSTKRFRAISCPANKRDYETVLGIITVHVAPGSTVVMDECSEYKEMTDVYDFLPQTVKSELLVNMKKRAYALDETLKAKRRKLATGNYLALGDELVEYMWRREIKFSKKDKFESFLAIIHTYFTF